MQKTIMLAVLLTPGGLLAQSADVDWNFFGGAVIDGKAQHQFYDGKSLVRRRNGNIEVWIKTLPEFQIKRIITAKTPDKAATERVAKKIATGYLPSIALVIGLTQDQQIDMVMEEDIANNAPIMPTSRMLVELDCAGRLERELSVYMVLGGKQGFKDTPSEWRHVAPETSVATLGKILCPKS